MSKVRFQLGISLDLRSPSTCSSSFRPISLNVLTVQEAALVEIVSFPSDPFPAFGLPPAL